MLVEYAAGALEPAPGVAITTHLQFCDECRRSVDSLQAIGGELLDSAGSIPVSESLLDDVFSHIDREEIQGHTETGISTSAASIYSKEIDEFSRSVPAYIRQFLPEDKLKWRFLSPSLKMAAIRIGEDVHELSFLKIKAGGKAPQHDHKGTEITVVLTGSFSDEAGLYQPGDFIVRQTGEIHQPIAARNEECICLSVLSAPIQLTGIKRLLNPFLGFTPG